MNLRISPKTKHSSLIALDDEIWGTLPHRVLLPLYPEDFCGEIGAAAADELIKLLRERAYSLVLDYLAKAEHSSLQCSSLLKRKWFHPSIVADTLARMREQGYLDDGRFAEVLIRSWLARKASRRAIIAKLREQRVPSDLWEPLLQELWSPDEASESLTSLMQKYCSARRHLSRPDLKKKAFSHFFRKGFDLEDIAGAWERSGPRNKRVYTD